MTVMLKGRIRNGRVEVDMPFDLPEGTEVSVTPHSFDCDKGPMSPVEIARVQAAMQTLLPIEIPAEVAADLDEWEERINRHGIEHGEKGLEHVFR